MTRLALFVMLCGVATACMAPPASPEAMARCMKMYRLWMKYEAAENPSFHPQHATVDLALHRCQTGRYDEGMAALEKVLRRDLIPVPPPL